MPTKQQEEKLPAPPPPIQNWTGYPAQPLDVVHNILPPLPAIRPLQGPDQVLPSMVSLFYRWLRGHDRFTTIIYNAALELNSDFPNSCMATLCAALHPVIENKQERSYR